MPCRGLDQHRRPHTAGSQGRQPPSVLSCSCVESEGLSHLPGSGKSPARLLLCWTRGSPCQTPVPVGSSMLRVPRSLSVGGHGAGRSPVSAAHVSLFRHLAWASPLRNAKSGKAQPHTSKSEWRRKPVPLGRGEDGRR